MTIDLFDATKIRKRLFEIEEDAIEFAKQILVDSHCKDPKVVTVHNNSRNDSFIRFIDDKETFRIYVRIAGKCLSNPKKRLLFDIILSYKDNSLVLINWKLL